MKISRYTVHMHAQAIISGLEYCLYVVMSLKYRIAGNFRGQTFHA